jgi:hypothetical protein
MTSLIHATLTQVASPGTGELVAKVDWAVGRVATFFRSGRAIVSCGKPQTPTDPMRSSPVDSLVVAVDPENKEP